MKNLSLLIIVLLLFILTFITYKTKDINSYNITLKDSIKRLYGNIQTNDSLDSINLVTYDSINKSNIAKNNTLKRQIINIKKSIDSVKNMPIVKSGEFIKEYYEVTTIDSNIFKKIHKTVLDYELCNTIRDTLLNTITSFSAKIEYLDYSKRLLESDTAMYNGVIDNMQLMVNDIDKRNKVLESKNKTLTGILYTTPIIVLIALLL
jgi:hypothetical protein